MRVYPKREKSEENNELECLTLYDKHSNMIIRSEYVSEIEEIHLEYDGIYYISLPGQTDDCMVLYSSLTKKFDKI